MRKQLNRGKSTSKHFTRNQLSREQSYGAVSSDVGGINSFYVRQDVLSALRKEFSSDAVVRSVAIGAFLDPNEFSRTELLCKNGWTRSVVPDRHSFSVHDWMIVNERIAAFAALLSGKKILREGNRRFGHRDYTILHDNIAQRPGVVAFLFLEDWDPAWGGSLLFVKGGKTLLSFIPRKNTLLVVERKKGVRYFVKFINHKAQRRRMTIIG